MDVNLKSISRFVLQLSLVGLVGFSLITPAGAAPKAATNTQKAEQPITVLLDQQLLQLKTSPILIKGNLMLPAKAFFDQVGVRLSFEKGELTAVKGDLRVEGKLNSTKVVKGKQTFILPAAPVSVEGRLYIPMRFAALVLDKDITYDNSKRQVLIGYSKDQMLSFQRLLFQAAHNGDPDVVKLMIAKGVDVNLKLVNMYGDNTALDYAIISKRTDVVRILLEHGASFDPARSLMVIQDRNGQMLELLLAHGLDPNWKFHGTSLLSYASGRIYSVATDRTETMISPSVQLVDLLLKYGADPSEDDSLMKAVNARNFDIIQALLRHGADPYRMDSMGSTPYERAKSEGITSWMELTPYQEIPKISIQKADGSPILEGTLNVIIKNGFQGNSIHWSGEEAYLDLPLGEYWLSDIMLRGSSYMFLPDTKIILEEGKATPAVFKLPPTNVNGTIVGATKEQQNGYLYLAESSERYGMFIEVIDGKFSLSVPPGSYRTEEYRLADKTITLKGSTSFTVTEGGEVQQITLNMP